MIPLLRPSCSGEEIDAVAEVLRSGYWGDGPKCKQFEAEIAAMTGYQHAVTVNSATAALHMALLALNIGPGDEVIVPALTFVSTALAVSYTGAKPVFADVCPDTLTMDWYDAEYRITTRTKAFIPVDYAGYPAMHMAYGKAAATYFGMPVIQDAAHSCGGITYGKLVCYSFHPVKNLATGDGGCVLTNNAADYERMRALRWCGINKSTHDRISDVGSGQRKYGWNYDIQEIGYKCHWNDIQAAIGLAQLHRLKELNAKRALIANWYTAALCDHEQIQLPEAHNNHTWHIYAIRVPAEKRDKVIDHLLSQGISAGVHYKPLTYYLMYSDQTTPPVTETEWQRLVTLPMYYDLDISTVGRITDEVKKALL